MWAGWNGKRKILCAPRGHNGCPALRRGRTRLRTAVLLLSAGIRSDPVLQTKAIAGVPLYAFDKHTRIGKRAIERLIGENKPFRDRLVRFLAKGSPRKGC
jgi:hypothetical protein